MAIGTDSTIHFFGTQDSVDDGSTSAISNTAFSVAADITDWTNDDDAPLATFVLKFQYPSGTIVADGIHLFAKLNNIDSTNDEDVPSASYPHHYLGTFVTDGGLSATVDQYIGLGPVALPNQYTSQSYSFYIQNDTNVTVSASWTLKITPMTLGPHA